MKNEMKYFGIAETIIKNALVCGGKLTYETPTYTYTVEHKLKNIDDPTGRAPFIERSFYILEELNNETQRYVVTIETSVLGDALIKMRQAYEKGDYDGYKYGGSYEGILLSPASSPMEEDSPLQVLEGLINNCSSLKALKGTLRQAIDNGNLDSYEIDALSDTLRFLSNKQIFQR